MLPAPQSPRKWKIGVKGPKLILFYSYGCGLARRSFSDVPGAEKKGVHEERPFAQGKSRRLSRVFLVKLPYGLLCKWVAET